MATKTEKLVIVESPAKAKTISRFLGSEYRVEASVGHVRDLPENASEVPAEIKDKPWGNLAVDVENDFTPYYVIPSSKKQHVARLRKALEESKELLLATDEDREGESISWHVLQVLKPKKDVPVQRIVFHEVTREAILDALKNPRDVDEALVRAQETRRILDRLYGYSLSPLLWKKVRRNLSAGRVQSVAVRLLVEREQERMRFKSAEYWDLEATLGTNGDSFVARLVKVDDATVATGKHFDPDTGELKDDVKDVLWLREADATRLAEASAESRPWTVTSRVTKPGTEKPAPPFITSTLQQEANRRLRFTARHTMSIAQQLYEGVDLDGERVGLITYMRTDSVALADRAVKEIRETIEREFGRDYLPDKPRRYKTKTRNAQEAHEAIRPTDIKRKPEDVARFLTKDQAALYELIYKRTLACQMTDARVERTRVEVEVTTSNNERLLFTASGKTILFPGFLKAYGYEENARGKAKETRLPSLEQGQELHPLEVKPLRHQTEPPARYTEASLVKRLEEEGIGRPSTYATIISTLLDRDYAFKRDNELVPTFTAMCVNEVMLRYFPTLVDLKFTARMEDDLDDIARGTKQMVSELREFYYGSDSEPGLEPRLREQTPLVEPPKIPIGADPSTGEMIYARVGRYGEYLSRGDGEDSKRVTIPPNTAPADLTPERAAALLDGKDVPITTDPKTGRPVFLKTGRYGAYLEVKPGDLEGNPKRVSVPKNIKPENLDEDTVLKLLALPRTLGVHPETGAPVTANLGPYGPYVQHQREFRSLPSFDALFTTTLEQALALLAQPKQPRRRQTAEELRELGEAEGCAGTIKVMSGRYGPYITDGKTNATLPKDVNPEDVTLEEAAELIRTKAASKPTRRRPRA